MSNIATKKVYKVTLECKLKNKWAGEDGMTWGLKSMNDVFWIMINAINRDPRTGFASKSRKCIVEEIL